MIGMAGNSKLILVSWLILSINSIRLSKRDKKNRKLFIIQYHMNIHMIFHLNVDTNIHENSIYSSSNVHIIWSFECLSEYLYEVSYEDSYGDLYEFTYDCSYRCINSNVHIKVKKNVHLDFHMNVLVLFFLSTITYQLTKIHSIWI